MRESDSIDDTTPLQNVTVSVPKEQKTKNKDEKSNYKEVCCCIILCLVAFLILMYICITFGQRNRNNYGYG
tara:strand:- start:1680 stop:1892 length:213 start_codon:yes stop_codon:yes gene_type:complete